MNFTPAAFGFLSPVTAHGAAKLASSGIAPLVAAARGYFTVEPASLKEAFTELRIATAREARGAQLKSAVANEDALVMPWFGLTGVAEAAVTGGRPGRTSYQIRPATPVVNKDGKSAKYLFPKDAPTAMDAHPATPAGWFTDARTVLLAEGLMKADSALTALLIASGASTETMLNDHNGDRQAARAALSALMDAVPEAERVLIIGLAGSGNWHSHSDWNGLSLKGRAVWVGLDADVASNSQVWRQASQLVSFLKEKKKPVSIGLLNLPEVNGDAKAGLDDYLAAGGDWTALPGMLGSLPVKPEDNSDFIEIQLAEVDMEAGITTMTKRVETEAGEVEKQIIVAEAAVIVETVSMSREADEDQLARGTVSGKLSWIVRTLGGGREVRRKRFTGVRLEALVGRSATPTEFLAAATEGSAAGAVIDPHSSREVMAAWMESLSRASQATTMDHSGFYEHNGTFGALTTNGLVHSGGVDESVKARISHLPAIEMPYIQLDSKGKMSKEDALRVLAAFREVVAVGEIFDESQRGFWEASIGMNVAISALDLQAKGTILLMGIHGFGKTSALLMCGGWNGPAWLKDVAVRLNGTEAAILGSVNSGSGIVFPVDDARDSDDAEASGSKLRQIRSAIDAMIRMGYEPEKPVYLKKVQDANGKWRPLSGMPNARRSTIISGENIEILGISPSSAQRMISWDVSEATPLFRGRGEVGPAIEALHKSGAQALLRGAVVQRQIAKAEKKVARGEASTVREAMQEYSAGVAYAFGKSVIPEATERDREFLAPIVGGLAELAMTVGEAASVLPEWQEIAGEVDDWWRAAWESVEGAWERHQARYGDQQDRPWAKYVEIIEELVDTEHVSFSNSINSIGKMGIGDDGDIVVIPGMMLSVLRTAGNMPNLTSGKLKAAFKNAIIEERKSIRMAHKTPKGWLISGAKWRAALEPSARPEGAPVPLPKPESVDWDSELETLTAPPVVESPAEELVTLDYENCWPDDDQMIDSEQYEESYAGS